MAQKSTREGLKKEYVDYLGNLIIDGKIKKDILNLGDSNYVSKSNVLSYEEILASTDLSGKIASADAFKFITRKKVGVTSNNPVDLNSFTDIYTTLVWDFGGSSYVTQGGVQFGSTAGSVFNLVNLGGVTQVFIQYNTPNIKIRVKYLDNWSDWKTI